MRPEALNRSQFMKSVYVVLISCLFAQACFSQAHERSGLQAAGRFRLGVTAGTQVTHAKMQGTYVYTEAAPDKLGWMAGMVGQFDLINNLIVDASLGVSHDAVHTDAYITGGGLISPIYANYDFTWMENRVSLKYKFLRGPAFSLYVGAGIAANLLIKCKETWGVQSSSGQSWKATHEMHRLNCAVPIAAGAEFPFGDRKFGCTFSYHVGLRGVYKPVLDDTHSYYLFEDGMYKMNTARVSLAYIFSVSKRSSKT
jgi:hypothetical protein